MNRKNRVSRFFYICAIVYAILSALGIIPAFIIYEPIIAICLILIAIFFAGVLFAISEALELLQKISDNNTGNNLSANIKYDDLPKL